MSWLQEAHRAMTGSWRLLLRDTGGYDEFDLTERGFWRSFTAIVPAAPFYLYAATVELPRELSERTELHQTSIGSAILALLVAWVSWPLIMVFVARLAGFAHNYSRYIIALNWSSILVMAAQTIPAALLAQGGQMTELGTMAYYVFVAFALYYHWYIASTALETTMGLAWILVLGDLALGISVTILLG